MTKQTSASQQLDLGLSRVQDVLSQATESTHRKKAPAANSSGDEWPADLTRRLRVLLHTSPLDGLRRSDAIRDAEFRHYDSLALALRVLDVVIDRSVWRQRPIARR